MNHAIEPSAVDPVALDEDLLVRVEERVFILAAVFQDDLFGRDVVVVADEQQAVKARCARQKNALLQNFRLRLNTPISASPS